MYRVEYLILVDRVNTTSIKALKNLIQSDDDFSIKKDQIQFRNYSFGFEIATGRVLTSAETPYFHMKLMCSQENDIPDFSLALKHLRKILAILNRSQFTIWDDVSKYYSAKAYDKINHVENLMRKLLTKFMIVNLGMDWTSERVPKEVKASINPANNDVNFLHNVDFIQLRNFLFSENYPAHRESLIKKLHQAKDLSNIDLEEIKLLLPESNWRKCFEDLVECEGDYLNKRWSRLYELRNAIAHNKSFNSNDLNEVIRLTTETDAISKLDEVVIPPDEIKDVVDSVASEKSLETGEFIAGYRDLEYNLKQLIDQNSSIFKDISASTNPIRDALKELNRKSIISKQLWENWDQLSKIRNVVVHSSSSDISPDRLKESTKVLKAYSEDIRNLIQVDEEDHISHIKNKNIVDSYKYLKRKTLELPNVQIKFNKHYISFIAKSNFTDMRLQQSSLEIWLNVKIGDLIDDFGIVKDVSNVGHLGNGDYEIRLESTDNLDKVFKLIKQAYEKNVAQ